MDIANVLFSLIRQEITSVPVDREIVKNISEETLQALWELSKAHDMAHIVGNALLRIGVLSQEGISKLFRNAILRAVYRYEGITYELGRICQTLEKAQIPFIPLKGSVIRQYYPEPWMRTSCDIDILVHEESLEQAISLLAEELNYTKDRKGSHDFSLYSPNGIHLELHYDLVEGDVANAAGKVLKSVWEYVSSKTGFTYWQEMSDAMFYFYHIAHMAKHLQQGGCGIRPFVDLWILNKLDSPDIKERGALLKKAHLYKFAQAADKLNAVWLTDAAHDSVTQKLQDYIFHGGTYGALDSQIAIRQQKKGGKLQYAISKIIIPYSVIKHHYPVLQRHPWLTPLMQVRRWGKLIFFGHMRRSIKELAYSQSISKMQAEEIQVFLEQIGL